MGVKVKGPPWPRALQELAENITEPGMQYPVMPSWGWFSLEEGKMEMKGWWDTGPADTWL